MSDKLYNLVEKMYIEFTGRFEQMHTEFTDRFEQMHTEFTGRFEQMHTEFTGRFDKVDQRMESMDQRMDSLENRQARLEMRIEHDIVPKINALYDDRDEIKQSLSDINTKVDKMAGTLENHELRIRVLEGRKTNLPL